MTFQAMEITYSSLIVDQGVSSSMRNNKNRPRSSTTVRKALDILCCFSASNPVWGISELSRELHLSKSHVHQLLKSLEEKGFAQRDLILQRYKLGFKLMELGEIVSRTLDVRRAAAPFMQDLQRQVGGTVSLRVLDNDELLVVERIEPSDFLRVAYPVGTRLPYNHGAGGKVLLAFMDQAERKSLFRRKPLKKLTKKTITDPKRLETELNTIRKRDFALSKGEAVPGGAVGVAAPIRDSRGTVTAALAVTLPASLVASVSFPRIIRSTASTAFRISEALGYKNSSGK
jgi:DNA-binding IclR family transcriptional regulator